MIRICSSHEYYNLLPLAGASHTLPHLFILTETADIDSLCAECSLKEAIWKKHMSSRVSILPSRGIFSLRKGRNRESTMTNKVSQHNVAGTVWTENAMAAEATLAFRS